MLPIDLDDSLEDRAVSLPLLQSSLNPTDALPDRAPVTQLIVGCGQEGMIREFDSPNPDVSHWC